MLKEGNPLLAHNLGGAMKEYVIPTILVLATVIAISAVIAITIALLGDGIKIGDMTYYLS